MTSAEGGASLPGSARRERDPKVGPEPFEAFRLEKTIRLRLFT
jgi:hypothetical protein